MMQCGQKQACLEIPTWVAARFGVKGLKKDKKDEGPSKIKRAKHVIKIQGKGEK